MKTLEELADSAIIKLKKKIMPVQLTEQSFNPELEPFMLLSPILEIWDRDKNSEETREQLKFIYDYWKQFGEPQEKVIDILTRIGTTPLGDSRLSRVYRYTRLRHEEEKSKKRTTELKKEIKSFEASNT